MAALVKLKIDQGATFRQRVTWQTGTPAVAVNLTGYTARMQIRDQAGATALYIELNTTNGGIVLGGVTGTIDLYISAANTAAFTWTTANYDIDLTAPSGDVTRLFMGSITISPGVTV